MEKAGLMNIKYFEMPLLNTLRSVQSRIQINIQNKSSKNSLIRQL